MYNLLRVKHTRLTFRLEFLSDLMVKMDKKQKKKKLETKKLLAIPHQFLFHFISLQHLIRKLCGSGKGKLFKDKTRIFLIENLYTLIRF